MHAMCSYQGMFPARLAHYFLSAYSKRGDRVVDPFSGRGTTALQARVEGREALASDLNPLAFVLSRAKSRPARWGNLMTRIDLLEKEYMGVRNSVVIDAPREIEMLFHTETLREIAFLRSVLLSRSPSRWSSVDFMIAGAVAGILHGSQRADGTSAYLSVSMPNTFSMAPGYVARYIEEQGLRAERHPVFANLRRKVGRLYMDDLAGPPGVVCQEDATAFLMGLRSRSVDLILTSPPYLKVVNYGTSNWIRLWWLGLEGVGQDGGAGRKHLDNLLDHQHTYSRYRDFILGVFAQTARVLRAGGHAVFVIGDVAQPGKAPFDLAGRLWADLRDQVGLDLLDQINDDLPSEGKVSRILGRTKGNATQVDRILIFRRKGQRDSVSASKGSPAVDWDEPYKDAGPDSAHRAAAGT